MMIVERRDIRPVLVKFGVAIALSGAGFTYSRLRNMRIKLYLAPPSPQCSDDGTEVDLGGQGEERDDEALKDDVYADKTCNDNSVTDFSQRQKHNAHRHGFLSPECNEDKEYMIVGPSLEKDLKALEFNVDVPRCGRSLEKEEYEQEIKHLRNMVRVLQEREKNLEVQLLRYCGLKEQGVLVMQLQNRIKISDMEAELLTIKIESL